LSVSKKLSSIKLLDSKGVKYQLIELTNKAITIKEVIKFSKDEINPNEICKTIILNSKKRKNRSSLKRR
jgi:hypothetical protein